MKGIDVSKHNGAIDFTAVRNAGFEFAILRAGYGKYESQKDPRFEENYRAAKAAGLHVGSYWYSYALSPDEAIKEAETCLHVIAGKQFDFPIYFDIEDPSQSNLGCETITNMIIAFCDRMEQSGYFAGVYANTDWFLNRIDQNRTDRFTKWLADYRTNYNTTLPRDVHQYTSSGTVPGISGRVDENNATRDFPSQIIQAGLNGYESSAPSEHVVGMVTANGVRLRSEPNTSSNILAVLNTGDLFDVVDDRNGDAWLKVRWEGKEGYLARQYTNGDNGSCVEESAPVYCYTTGNYQVTATRLNVRKGPGVQYPIKSVSELSPSAQAQGGYCNGVVFTALETQNLPGESWARTPSGWVCLQNGSGIYCRAI